MSCGSVDLGGRSCSLFGVEFRPEFSVASTHKFVEALELFGIGASWGGYEVSPGSDHWLHRPYCRGRGNSRDRWSGCTSDWRMSTI